MSYRVFLFFSFVAFYRVVSLFDHLLLLGFYWKWIELLIVSCASEKVYWVFGLIEFGWVLTSFFCVGYISLSFDWVFVLNYNQFFLVLSNCNGFYWVLLGFTGFYRVLPGFTGFYRV